MTNLKVCPFCGGVARRDAARTPDPNRYWVACRTCGASVSTYGSRESATEAWNSRKESKALQPDPQLLAYLNSPTFRNDPRWDAKKDGDKS